MPRPMSTRCTTRNFARTWCFTAATTTRRRALFPRVQSARWAAPASLRSSHSCGAEWHPLRRSDRHDPRRRPGALRRPAARPRAGGRGAPPALRDAGCFLPVAPAPTKARPDEIDTLISAEAGAGALAEIGFTTDIVAIDLDLNPFCALKRRNPILVFN